MLDELMIAAPEQLAAAGPFDAAIVLGSGLAGLVGAIAEPMVVPYSSIPGVPLPGSHVAGHSGQLVVGSLGGKRVVCFEGRVHRYQGFSAREAAFPARLAAGLGAPVLIVTNAAGGVADHLDPGDIVLISDQINLTGDNPLVGWPGPPGGVPFVPMRDAYDPALRKIAIEAALSLDVPIEPEGVYVGLLGPAYETPAEVEMLRRLGADVVGMSTVPEVIAARALGLRVLGFSLVTNVAAGAGLSHAEVLEAGRVAADNMERLVTAILARLS